MFFRREVSIRGKESMTIGERLKEIRIQKGLTLKQVGEYLGGETPMTPTAISSYESGTRMPSATIISKLAELYETTTDDIMGIRTDTCNLNTILTNNKLHWDGIPLREDELNFIRQFLDMRKKDKMEAKSLTEECS